MLHRGCAILKKPPAPAPFDLRSAASTCLPVDVVDNLAQVRVRMESSEGEDDEGGGGGEIVADLLVPAKGTVAAPEMTRWMGKVGCEARPAL